MRRFATSAILVTFLPLAAPAGAQFVPGRPPPPQTRLPSPIMTGDTRPGMDIWRGIGDLRADIDRGRAAGSLSKREARSLRREARAIGALADRYGNDGLSASERHELESRSLYLQGLINAQRSR